jgi:hypothetical protein
MRREGRRRTRSSSPAPGTLRRCGGPVACLSRKVSLWCTRCTGSLHFAVARRLFWNERGSILLCFDDCHSLQSESSVANNNTTEPHVGRTTQDTRNAPTYSSWAVEGGTERQKVCASPATFPQRPSCVNALSFLFDRFGPFYFWLRFGFGVNELLFHGARFVNAMTVKTLMW